jgi:hypothetical protein
MAAPLSTAPLSTAPLSTADPRPWLPGTARHVEFVARDLAELAQAVVHLNPSVRFAAAGQIANVVARNRLFIRRPGACA